MEIHVNEVILNYEVRGEGSPLLLLHGNGEDLHIFDKIAPKLAAGFKVYAIDSRNHGLSSKGVGCSYDDMAADVAAFVGVLGLEGVSVVGFSDGAIIALIAAIQDSSLFSRMALLGINLSPEDFKPEIMEEMRVAFEATGDPLVGLMLTQPDIKLEDVSKVNVPALIVAGEDDIYVPESFERLASAMPDASLAIIEGHDHGSYIIDNDILYPLLKDFLA